MPRRASQVVVAEGSGTRRTSTPAKEERLDPTRDSDRPRDLDARGGGQVVHVSKSSARDRVEIASSDPGFAETPDEVWFDPEELAAASTVELGRPASMRSSPLRMGPHPELLASRLQVAGSSWATLPGWPGSPASGQGIGAALGSAIGELHAGDVVLVTASERGAGRTTLLAQIADGAALGGQTPVSIISADCSPSTWRARSLARFSGLDARCFEGSARAGAREVNEALAAFAERWAGVVKMQRFAESGVLEDGAESLVHALRRWQAELGAARGPGDDGACPLLVVDPLTDRWSDLPESLARLAGLAHREGWIVLASAHVPASPDPAWTRQVDRCLAARLRVQPRLQSRLRVEVQYRRLGPTSTATFAWTRSCSRLEPVE